MISVSQTKLILGRKDLHELGLNVSNTTLLRWEALGRFPRRIRMGGTAVGWLAIEVAQWLKERDSERVGYHYEDPR